jgi:shikimate 5-dehydrogenase
MLPHPGDLPGWRGAAAQQALLYDLIYKLPKRAMPRAAGRLQAANGLGMLVEQEHSSSADWQVSRPTAIWRQFHQPELSLVSLTV